MLPTPSGLASSPEQAPDERIFKACDVRGRYGTDPTPEDTLCWRGTLEEEMGKITGLLKERASVRTFQDRPVPESVLSDILEAGRLSPSGGNEQPWRFGVITDPALIAELAQIAHHQTWMAQAPLLIVLCTVLVSDERGGRNIQMQRYPEHAARIAEMDQDLYWALNQEEHQTKIAGTHMVLAAQEHGLGSCWVSRFEVRALARLLNLPRGSLPAEILALGYPAQIRTPVAKRALGETVFHNRLE